MSGISYSQDLDMELRNQNPNFEISQVEEFPLFSQLNFPSPFFYENQLFFDTIAADQTQQASLEPILTDEPFHSVSINMNTAQEISTNTSSAGTHLHSEPRDNSSRMKKSASNKGSTARKSGKKDRHSKINTAQGVRDRRMRLSRQIARQFFDLQDMLGFDKASKTIDWLFSKSKKAIKQLNCSPSHVSQMNNNYKTYQNGSRGGEKSEQKRKVNTAAASESEGVSGLVKTAEKSVASGNTKYTAKELRDKARARARERTREKMMTRCLEKSNHNLYGEAYNLAQLGPAKYTNLIGQELMSNSSIHQDNIWTSQSSLHCQLANIDLLGATASPSGSVFCSMFNYGEKNGNLFTGELGSFSNNLCYHGNWDITSEYSNPNSINIQENPGNHFQYSDHNQVA